MLLKCAVCEQVREKFRISTWPSNGVSQPFQVNPQSCPDCVSNKNPADYRKREHLDVTPNFAQTLAQTKAQTKEANAGNVKADPQVVTCRRDQTPSLILSKRHREIPQRLGSLLVRIQVAKQIRTALAECPGRTLPKLHPLLMPITALNQKDWNTALTLAPNLAASSDRPKVLPKPLPKP